MKFDKYQLHDTRVIDHLPNGRHLSVLLGTGVSG
jgi:hypothetical protein